MTSQDAKQQLNACENRIINTHNELCMAARSMGTSAVDAAEKKTRISTIWPLCISLFGLFCCSTMQGIAIGIILIIVGIIIVYNTRKSAKYAQGTIKSHQNLLNTDVDNNLNI